MARIANWLRLLSKLPLSIRNLREHVDRVEAVAEAIRNRSVSVETLEEARSRLETRLDAIDERLARLQEEGLARDRVVRALFDDTRRDRDALRAFRESREYDATFEEESPLVSVAIATYDRPELLFERAVASVRAQTYTNWEIVIVGDGCSDSVREAIESKVSELRDPRIRFENLPYHAVGPDAPHHRWMVGGTQAINRAMELVRGQWIAPLDDDDEFLPTHIETLLAIARDRRVEVAYGAIDVRHPGRSEYLYSFPPAGGRFGFQAALFMRGLRFFEFRADSWVIETPGDMQLLRRMVAAGVLFGSTEAIVTTYHPSVFRAS